MLQRLDCSAVGTVNRLAINERPSSETELDNY